MSVTQNAPEQAGNIAKFAISSNFEDNAIDLSAGVVDYRYYESVLSNAVTATATVVETGFKGDEKGNTKTTQGTIDSLPIRGGERTDIIIEDTYGNELKLDDGLYVNRVRDVDPGTQTDLYFLDFASREYFANEQTRVTKRYEGNISQNIKTILKDVLEVEGEPDVDDTAEPYNFMGNDKKPFYVCTWLASKSIPQIESEDGKPATGGSAGYFFYQTREGFHFKSIDKIFQGEPTKKYIYNNNPKLPEGYDAKVLTYDIESDIDLHEKLMLGTYNNRSIYFDFLAMNYVVQNYSLEPPEESAVSTTGTGNVETKNKITPAGKQIDKLVAKEFLKSPSRLMSHLLDVGTLPNGVSPEKQLEHWRENKDKPNFKAAETMQASIMRYNQLFTIKTNITIPGDFSLKAGDIVQCDFPELSGSPTKEINPESRGIYMISSVCHKVTPGSSLTSLSLVRDSYGKK